MPTKPDVTGWWCNPKADCTLLSAGTGTDALFGGTGSDTMVAATGNAQMVAGAGHAGADEFLFSNGAAVSTNTIWNFIQGQDHVAMFGYGPNAVSNALASAVVAGGSTTVTLYSSQVGRVGAASSAAQCREEADGAALIRPTP